MPDSPSQSQSSSSTPIPSKITSPATSSSTTAIKRLLHEISSHEQNPNPSLLHLGPVSDANLLRWEAVLRGPRHSPYAGGLWLLSIQVPPTYPLNPPKITFLTPICHPNVHFVTGDICLTLLTTEHWSPLYTLSSTLSAVQQLLLDPVAESPLNVDVANLYREGDTVAAEALVRFWTVEKRWKGEGEGQWISEVIKGQSGKLGE